MPDRSEGFRFMRSHPEKLRNREPRKHQISGVFEEECAAQSSCVLLALEGASLVVPEQCGANDFLVCIQRHQAVHLTRKGDRHYVIRFDFGV